MTLDAVPARRPRVLLSAYCCSPVRGSEPSVGWNRVIETARYCDTWVLCEERDFADEIRTYFAQRGPQPHLHFEFIPRVTIEPHVRNVPGAYYVCYNIWQRRALRVARRLHQQVGFDLVHQVNLMGYREPGYLWRLGVPFIWGPWGGTQNVPVSFLKHLGWREGLTEAVRGAVNWTQLRWSRHVRRAARAAAELHASNSSVQQAFARAHGITPRLSAGNGIQQLTPGEDRTPSAGRPLRILWAGRLQATKALPLLLRALAKLPASLRYELRVMGRGPQKAAWQRLAEELGVARNVNWLPFLPREAVPVEFQRADVFAFTSLRDTMPTVVLEALAAGTPVVCLDHQGMADTVTDDCGLRVPVETLEGIASGLAAALVRLAEDPQLYRQLSAGALRQAERYLWAEQGRELIASYRRVLGEDFMWEPRVTEPAGVVHSDQLATVLDEAR